MPACLWPSAVTHLRSEGHRKPARPSPASGSPREAERPAGNHRRLETRPAGRPGAPSSPPPCSEGRARSGGGNQPGASSGLPRPEPAPGAEASALPVRLATFGSSEKHRLSLSVSLTWPWPDFTLFLIGSLARSNLQPGTSSFKVQKGLKASHCSSYGNTRGTQRGRFALLLRDAAFAETGLERVGGVPQGSGA